MNKKILRRYIIIVALIALIGIMVLLRNIPSVSNWMARNFSPLIITCFGTLTSLVPFSIFEWLVLAAIIFLIYAIVKIIINIKRKNYKRMNMTITSVLMATFIVINVYMMSAAFSYYSDEIDVDVYTEELQPSQAVQICDYFVEDYGYTASKLTFDSKGNVVMPYSFNELAKKIIKEYEKLDYPFLNKYTPLAKPLVFSNVMGHIRIYGLAFSPMGEIQINADAPASSLPTTIAHEIAHIKGVMREDEANMMALLVTLNSEDDFIRFCGYYRFWGSIDGIAEVAGEEYYDNFFPSYTDIISAVSNEYYRYWSQYNGIIGRISNWFNDVYLKLSGIKDGTGSYDTPEIPPSEIEIPSDNEDDPPIIIIQYHMNKPQQIILQIYNSKYGING